MNLTTLTELYAGGPGSGPNAPCPQCGPHSGKTTKYQEGDKVKILVPVKTWNERTWNRKVYQPGKIATVQNVLPPIGHQSEQVKIKFGKRSSEEYIDIRHVEFHKKAGKPLDPGGKGVKSKPIPDKKAVMKVKLPEGGRYGVAKPAGEPKESRGETNYENRAHPLKDQYEKVDAVTGFSDVVGHANQNLRSFIYEAKREDGGGSVVWVHRYSDDRTGKVRQTIIGEVNYKNEHYKFGSPKSFEYNNPAKAFKTLRDRYGIKMTMKDWRYR